MRFFGFLPFIRITLKQNSLTSHLTHQVRASYKLDIKMTFSKMHHILYSDAFALKTAFKIIIEDLNFLQNKISSTERLLIKVNRLKIN